MIGASRNAVLRGDVFSDRGRRIRRLRNRFNLAVSEVGGQDTWQRAVVGMTAAGSDREKVRQVLHSAVVFVEQLHLAEVRGSDIEILDLPLSDRETFPSWEFQE